MTACALTWRKTVNAVMLTLTGVCTLVDGLGCCSSSWDICSMHGGRSLNWDFFTKLPDAGRRNRRRYGQCHRGQRQAAAAGRRSSAFPSDFWAACIWPNSAAGRFPFVVRYTTDLLNGVPSIVIGIFAYTLIVLPHETFLDAGRRHWPWAS